MTLNDAFELCDNNIITESSKEELIKLFNKVQANELSEEDALRRIKVGTNFTELKNGEEKPEFVLKGFGKDKNLWIQEFANSFPAESKAAATNFFKKVLLQARDRISNINNERRVETVAAGENAKLRQQMRNKNFKTRVEFHGYGN